MEREGRRRKEGKRGGEEERENKAGEKRENIEL